MIIEIELLIILLLILEVGIWLAWVKISTIFIVRGYKKENDKGYIGEENRKRLISEGERKAEGRESELCTTIPDIPGTTDIGERSDLQISDSIADGETDTSTGETSRSNGKVSRKFSNPFRRRGEKK